MNDSLERAVALQYQKENERPKIVAAGVGTLAKLIRRYAEEHGIPVREDSDVFELLQACRSKEPMSERATQVLSEIIRFLVALDAKHSGGANLENRADAPRKG